MTLMRYGEPVDSVFDLLGRNENDLTAALAFALAHSDVFAVAFLDLLGVRVTQEIALRLETSDGEGRTDLEVDLGDRLLIVEAKRGAGLPTVGQLERYGGRVRSVGGGLLATLSGAPEVYARLHLPAEVAGVPVRHVAWPQVLEALSGATSQETVAARRWVTELTTYLRKAIWVTDPASGWAYCVSVSRDKPGGGGDRSFYDYVQEDVYFHPYGAGSGWPIDPPTFMAFRWDGKVHQIRRVAGSEVIPSLRERWPDIPVTPETDRPHAVYALGPPLPMAAPLPSGTNYRAARLWVLIDQLLTQPTLKDALAASKSLTGKSTR